MQVLSICINLQIGSLELHAPVTTVMIYALAISQPTVAPVSLGSEGDWTLPVGIPWALPAGRLERSSERAGTRPEGTAGACQTVCGTDWSPARARRCGGLGLWYTSQTGRGGAEAETKITIWAILMIAILIGITIVSQGYASDGTTGCQIHYKAFDTCLKLRRFRLRNNSGADNIRLRKMCTPT